MWFKLCGDAVHGLADGDDEPAMDDELSELGAALVGVTAMPHEQFGKVVKLRYGKVCGEGGLAAFFPNNTNTNVGGLDHGDIVAAISDAGDPLASVVSN